MPKQVSLQKLTERLEQVKVRLCNSHENHKKALAFKNYVAVRIFVSKFCYILNEMQRWLDTLEHSGAIVDEMRKVFYEICSLFGEAAKADLQRNSELSIPKNVWLYHQIHEDDLIKILRLFKRLFYSREAMNEFCEKRLFAVFDLDDWLKGHPFSDYAWWCYKKAITEAGVDFLPKPAFLFDNELDAVVIDFYGWLEILPLSKWHREEISRRFKEVKENMQ